MLLLVKKDKNGVEHKIAARLWNDLVEAGHTDEQILAMSCRDRFITYCQWNGLLGSWGETLWDLAHGNGHTE